MSACVLSVSNMSILCACVVYVGVNVCVEKELLGHVFSHIM